MGILLLDKEIILVFVFVFVQSNCNYNNAILICECCRSMSMSTSVDDNGSSRRIMEEFSSQGAHVDATGGSEVFKAAIEEPIECQTEKGSGTNVMCLDASNDHIDHSGHENVSSQMVNLKTRFLIIFVA